MIADLVSRLGTNRKGGSSVDLGVPYQNIPALNMRGHRNESDWRANRVMELVDMAQKTVLDLGCSVGTMSSLFGTKAKKVIGVDYDDRSIDLARQLYNSNVTFDCKDITIEWLDSIERVDIVVWTSQFMWMVKQHGMQYALEFLWKLSEKCEVLVFETATRNDGLAPLDIKQEDVHKMLCKNTVFQEITDHGPWNDGWTPRNVFVCQKPFRGHTGEWSRVEIGGTKRVIKYFKDHPFAIELWKRELASLLSLSGSKYFPEVLGSREREIEFEWIGPMAVWIPEEDAKNILTLMKFAGLRHRDIRGENILWNGDNVVLIDFSFATIGDEITNYHYDLGGSYRCPQGFNDEYSLRKIQAELIGGK